MKLWVAEVKPGRTVPVEVLRSGSAKPLRATVGQAANDVLRTKADRSPDQQDPGALQGVILAELSSQFRQQLKIPRYVEGAVVLNINP